jgi:uncharacterized membrane protein YjgN (DUF898 family)
MEAQKPLQFNGTAAEYFVVAIVSVICLYIPVLGWAFLLNYACGWLADSSLVHGKKVAFKAEYGESLSFVFVNALLLFITFGIYMFWFVPKLYRYVTDHLQYVDETAPTPAAELAAKAVQPPVDPTNPPAGINPVGN